jgi:putative membrane protein
MSEIDIIEKFKYLIGLQCIKIGYIGWVMTLIKNMVDSKILVFSVVIGLLLIGAAYATGGHDLEEAKELIDAKVSCSQLTEEQLEHIGDYFMEQMHPGQQHEAMDEMMGGEGSESLRQLHIALAKRVYCNDVSGTTQYGMWGMMGRNVGRNTYAASGGMMGDQFGPYGWHYGWGFAFNIIFWILVISLVVWLAIRFLNPEKMKPMEILKSRYAKGEITKREFEQMKKGIR